LSLQVGLRDDIVEVHPIQRRRILGLANACPFCSCLDVRAINDPALELVGFRCHDCQRVFYVGTVKTAKAGEKNAAVMGRDRHPSRPAGRVED
jgi:transposase-like protein